MFLNKVTVAGNLGQDPEVKFFSDGKAVCNFSLATTEYWKDKSTGKKKENTEWHNIVIFGKLAEIVGEHFRKGSPIYLEGKLRTQLWDDKDSGKKQYKTEIVATEMQFIGQKPSSNQSAAPTNGSSNQANAGAKAKANADNTDGSDFFTPAEIEALSKGLPVKISKDDPNLDAKKSFVKSAYGYTWKKGPKEWSPKAS